MEQRDSSDQPTESGPEMVRDRLLQAALPHVPFDGWSDLTLQAAIADSGVAPGLAKALFPRGGVDLALAFHHEGDARMAERLAQSDLTALRYSDRVAFAIRTRLELVEDRELVRRGTTLFALPQNAAEGAKAIWATADAIWKALGDSSSDFNWYTKRMTLSGVYASTVLFWLGDDSPGHVATWDFLDRRIADVMQIEKVKAGLRDNPVARALRKKPFSDGLPIFKMPDKLEAPDDLPGRHKP